MSHLTKACEHSEETWCEACEFCCVRCGLSHEVDDDGYCDECAIDRAAAMADWLVDCQKYGETA